MHISAQVVCQTITCNLSSILHCMITEWVCNGHVVTVMQSCLFMLLHEKLLSTWLSCVYNRLAVSPFCMQNCLTSFVYAALFKLDVFLPFGPF